MKAESEIIKAQKLSQKRMQGLKLLRTAFWSEVKKMIISKLHFFVHYYSLFVWWVWRGGGGEKSLSSIMLFNHQAVVDLG